MATDLVLDDHVAPPCPVPRIAFACCASSGDVTGDVVVVVVATNQKETKTKPRRHDVEAARKCGNLVATR